MSGKYCRTYGRKKTNNAPPISQFDALISEAGKGAVKSKVTKTAGHFGKWGVGSYTSMRSINGSRDDEYKFGSADSPPNTNSNDPFSYDSKSINGSEKPVTYKKRKFFKTREPVVSDSTSINDGDNPRQSSPLIDEKINENNKRTASPLFSDNVSPSMDDNSNSCDSNKDSNDDSSVSCRLQNNEDSVPKPGLKLKIFKSRSGTNYSAKTLSSKDSEISSFKSIDLNEKHSSYSTTLADSSQDSSCMTKSIESIEADSLFSSQDTGFEEPTSIYDDTGTKFSNNSYTKKKSTLDSNDLDPNNFSSKSGLSSNESSSIPNSYCRINKYSSDNQSASQESNLSSSLGVNINKSDRTSSDDSNHIPVRDNKRCYSTKTKKARLSPVDENCPSSTLFSDVAQSQSKESSSNLFEVDSFIDDEIIISGVKESSSDTKETSGTKDNGCSLYKSSNPNQSTNIYSSSADLDLFGIDFDENEIIDRTSIDYPSMDSPLPTSSTSTQDPLPVPPVEKKPVKEKSPPPQPTKKRSIFKSRTNNDNKKRATYKHKWHGEEDKEHGDSRKLSSSSSFSASSTSAFDEFDFDAPLQRVQTWHGSSNPLEDKKSVVKVKCAKEVKEYYTVIKNVKRTHQLQESGEFQEFNDDVEYFLDALRKTNSISTRCLAALNLAQKCMIGAFRMHLRAHGTVVKFFKALDDAPKDQRLGICAAMVMFSLSQDRLNMDLDRDSLELMLNLLDSDTHIDEDGMSDQRTKIQDICKDLQKKGHAKTLNLDSLNAGTLAMETLLSLTSKRAGEWFKEELRDLGGVDHLIRTVSQCVKLFSKEYVMWDPALLEKLSIVDRCLKVLENITHQNNSNQEYLLQYENGLFTSSLMTLYAKCHAEVPIYYKVDDTSNTTAESLSTTLLTTLKVLVNLTHSSPKEALGSRMLGKKKEIYDLTLYCLLIMPSYLQAEKKFEIVILSCCLLLNLVEHSKHNRQMLMTLEAPVDMNESSDIFDKTPSAIEALVQLFYRSEESARVQEAHTDNIIDKDLTENEDNKDEEKKDDDIEETVAKLLQKAGSHMEETLKASYTALLTGYCLLDDEECQAKIRAMQPEGHFRTMVQVLKKFLRFMNLTATTRILRSLKPTENLVKYMEKLDRTAEEIEQEEKLKAEKARAEAFDAFGF